MSDNTQNILGFDSANNQFESTNVVANVDGSIIERIEHLQANGKNITSKVLTTTANGATTLFNYTGNIKINNIYGVISTVMENKTQNMKLSVKPDALVAYDICANKDIDTFAAGTLLSITGTAANAMVATTAVGTIAPSQAGGIIATSIASGIITVTAGAANTGAVTWYVDWEPLSSGATVTAA